MKMNYRSVTFAAALFCSNGLVGQLPSQKVLTLDVATTIAQAAMTSCRNNGYHVVVIVVDSGNFVKVLLRDDGAHYSTLEVGKMKATSVILMGRPSGPPANLQPGQPVPVPSVPGTVYVQGGLPILVDDKIIGAVSVSGAPGGDKDAACAAAGLAKAASALH